MAALLQTVDEGTFAPKTDGQERSNEFPSKSLGSIFPLDALLGRMCPLCAKVSFIDGLKAKPAMLVVGMKDKGIGQVRRSQFRGFGPIVPLSSSPGGSFQPGRRSGHDRRFDQLFIQST